MATLLGNTLLSFNRCHLGWQGPNCTECVRNVSCDHGYCHQPFECICEENWVGALCNISRNATNGMLQHGMSRKQEPVRRLTMSQCLFSLQKVHVDLMKEIPVRMLFFEILFKSHFCEKVDLSKDNNYDHLQTACPC